MNITNATFYNLQKTENITFSEEDNNQIYINVTSLMKLQGFEDFNKWLKKEENQNIEQLKAVLYFDMFGYKTPKSYSMTFYKTFNDELYVDFFVADLYVKDQNNTQIKGEIDKILKNILIN